MDQADKQPSIEKPTPKKTLREIYANAASGLLLMMDEEVSSGQLAASREEEQKSDETR